MDNLYVLAKPLDTSNKIIIDIQDVMDFCFCNQYHYLKNNIKKGSRDLYDEALHKTFYSYLIALQENRLEDALKTLKYKWGQEWIKYKNAKDILVNQSSSMYDQYEHKRKRGINAIFNFNDMMTDKQCPIIIGHKYQIEILPNIVLTGTFEYVREITINKKGSKNIKDNKKVIQIIKFASTTNRFRTNLEREHNIELIAMSYAFKEMFNVNDFQVLYMDIDTKKVTSTIFNQKDYDALKETVKNTVICMQNNIKCVSHDIKCFHCEYRNICTSNL